ncbi:TPA: phenylalanine--tRNA ligase subunit alpha [Candidatus Saccharibacteria bacterium]|nr:MAG: Phenylalanine-tRNA ligase [Candidatus Saccharibacteria bacterium GW2011_GWA2_46_10]HCM51898.1 phenylalanine--tRNA ligase subunit alpha [Candidatus Saccharibacteria bacterium]
MDMEYKDTEVANAAKYLKAKFVGMEDKKAILRDPKLLALYQRIKIVNPNERAAFGRELNYLRSELETLVRESVTSNLSPVTSIDVTAPFDVNVPYQNRPKLMPAESGSRHPLMTELELILDIFGRMGFTAVESRELDDDWHMFGSLNFPAEHPARDDYDTFVTDEDLVAPAHTSTMQNRVLRNHKADLKNGQPIAVVIPGRTFRNEDVDASHEHTFYQLEGVYVGRGIHGGHLVATLKAFLETYFQQKLDVKIQPFYFPFTEPSFEFAMSCPFCKKAGCAICKYTGWIEILGCGLIHPNVLKMGGIDPQAYTGFAWGGGIDRLVMMKYGIEDIRHFHSGNLKFLRQFA